MADAVVRSSEMARSSITLTDQERSLLTLLLGGATITNAAATLYVSKRTAESMLAALRLRVGAQTLYALGALAERSGWHEER